MRNFGLGTIPSRRFSDQNQFFSKKHQLPFALWLLSSHLDTLTYSPAMIADFLHTYHKETSVTSTLLNCGNRQYQTTSIY
jgi:hypothetical protein